MKVAGLSPLYVSGKLDQMHDDTTRIVIALDPNLQALVNAIYLDLQANNTLHALALRSKAISAHLTTVVASLQQLTNPSSGE